MDELCLLVIALPLMEKSITCQLNMSKISPSSASTTNHRPMVGWVVVSMVGWLFMQRRVTSYSCLDGRYLIFSIKGGAITDRHRSFMVNLPLPVRLVQIGFKLIQNLYAFLSDPPSSIALTAPAASSATFSTVETTTSFISSTTVATPVFNRQAQPTPFVTMIYFT
jgi:hypothetical protein